MLVAGAAILVVETLATRLVAPYVGLTLESTTAAIGVALLGIAAGAEALAADIAPFAAVCAGDAGRHLWAMTAHITYAALDPDRPATLSPGLIRRTIRGEIGFDGVLVSDDLTMGALAGLSNTLASDSLAAGCDLVLHCNGVPEDTAALLRSCPALGDAAARRMATARALVQAARPPAVAARAANPVAAAPHALTDA